jgi:hypothetical protein
MVHRLGGESIADSVRRCTDCEIHLLQSQAARNPRFIARSFSMAFGII